MSEVAGECIYCGSRQFRNSRVAKNVRCVNCNSTERLRVLRLYLDKLGLPKPGMSIMHLAPEPPLAKQLHQVSPQGYEAFDYSPNRYDLGFTQCRQLDLCRDAQQLPSERYDIIIHNHVIEHVGCNYTMVLLHLHRALKPEGYHIFSIPFTDHGSYADSLAPDMKGKVREKHFGQHSHARRFSREDFGKTVGMIFPIADEYNLASIFSPEILLRYHIDPSRWGLSSASVFILRKRDCLLTLPPTRVAKSPGEKEASPVVEGIRPGGVAQ